MARSAGFLSDEGILPDQRIFRDAQKLGWHVLVVWECEMENIERVSNKVREFLQGLEGKG